MTKQLEQPKTLGREYYRFFRAARQSTSPVVQFMSLYQILLMIFSDKQDFVDDFIEKHDPNVPQAAKPPRPKKTKKRKRLNETVYTRLRNEFAHKRDGVDIQKTKAEMADWLCGLIALTKGAIEGA